MENNNFKIFEEMFFESLKKNKDSLEPLPRQNEEWKEEFEKSLLNTLKEAYDNFPVSESYSGKEDRQYIVARTSAIIEIVTNIWCSFIESQILNDNLRCFSANGVDFQQFYMKVMYPKYVVDLRKELIKMNYERN